ncbi:MAG: DUF1294 domain-containing protein [Bacteroidia bacterium]|nr:DUF1294 domain-containing protein [Bacteroidia bacterium]
MDRIYQIILYYLLGINVLTLILFGVDKLKAKKHWWRIPESTLLILAVVGGSIGAVAGMYVFRHKTMREKFYIGIPFIILIQLGIIIYMLTK